MTVLVIIMLVPVVVIRLLLYLDARINGHIFLSLNESRLTQFRISLGFKFAIMNIIEDMVSSWESLHNIVALLLSLFLICSYRKAAINLPVVRDYHYSNSLQEAVWLPPELNSIS